MIGLTRVFALMVGVPGIAGNVDQECAFNVISY